ncbi:CDP-glycerol glycerophosphotransferase family protein [Shewanella maritima]|uniref:CDP-glycerol glycerophosphotransferase family protein n=1 Tax=Shewanella maritima TaxID=2520507 RepID=UPI003736ACF3
MTNRHTYARLGFLVHAAELCVHFHATWLLLDVSEFDVVIYGTPYERRKTRQLVNSIGVRAVDAESVITDKYQYDVLISNLSLFKIADKPLTKILGKFNIRQMYALGKGKHNFASWNSHYDLIMCFGPYQRERMATVCNTPTVEVGYPRYDRFFNESYNHKGMMEELGLDPNKKTILWLPTWLQLSSMDEYAEAISAISNQYNVIVKTHPLSLEAEPERIKTLNTFDFTVMINDVYDNLDLFIISDFVICDYGGTAFGALYLDLNLLLVNVEDAEQDSLSGEDSPDILLRESIINIDKTQKHLLSDILQNQSLWDKQRQIRQQLRQTYFTNEYGTASQRVVEVIHQQLERG